MKRIVFVLAIVFGFITVLEAQKISSKKVLKTAKKIANKANPRDALTYLTQHIDSTDKNVAKVFVQLGIYQREMLLLDSAKLTFEEALKSMDVEIQSEAKSQLEMVAKQKEKYNFNLVLFKSYIRQTDWVTANMSSTECQKYDTGNYALWFGLGEVAEHTKSVQEALELYQKASKKYVDSLPELAHIYEHISEMYIIQNKYSLAIDAANQSIKADKTWYEAYLLKGKAYFNLHDYSNAESNISIYLEHVSDNKEAWFLRGESLFYQKRYSSALSDYSASLAIDEKMTEARMNRAKSLYFLKQYQFASEDFEYLNNMFDGNYFALNGLGLCAYQQEKYDTAVRYFEQVTTLSTQDYYQFNLAMAYYRNKQLKLALRYFDILAQNHRYEPNYNVAKTWVLIELNELKKAKNWIDDSIKHNPYIKEYYAVRAKIYRKLNETKKAEKDERIAYTIEADPISFELKF